MEQNLRRPRAALHNHRRCRHLPGAADPLLLLLLPRALRVVVGVHRVDHALLRFLSRQKFFASFCFELEIIPEISAILLFTSTRRGFARESRNFSSSDATFSSFYSENYNHSMSLRHFHSKFFIPWYIISRNSALMSIHSVKVFSKPVDFKEGENGWESLQDLDSNLWAPPP